MPKKAKKPEKRKKAKEFEREEIPLDWRAQIELADSRSLACLFMTLQLFQSLSAKGAIVKPEIQEIIDGALLNLERLHAGSGPDAPEFERARALLETLYAAYGPRP